MIDFKKILKTSSFIDLIITFNLIVSIIGFVLVCFVFIVNMILDDFSKSNEEIEQITIEDVEIPPEYDARVEEIMNNMTIEEKMAEIKIVNRAKWVLIDRYGLSEPDAHRYIEKNAMDNGISKRAAADRIIAAEAQRTQ